MALRNGLRCVDWLLAEKASANRARRGSIKDWELHLVHGGPTSYREAEQSNVAGEQQAALSSSGVHFHVHGIPERAPFETLPPPRTLPAASAAPVPPAAPR